MALREEVVRSVYGVFLLARFDPRGMQYFNLTLEGFWRSFLPVVLATPLVLLITGGGQSLDETSQMARFTGEIVRNALQWVAFPLVMIPIARMFGLSRTYVPYIIAYNWAYVVQVALFVPLSLLSRIDVGAELAGLAGIAAELYVLLYYVFIARTALGVGTWTAIALVVLYFVLSYFIYLQAGAFF